MEMQNLHSHLRLSQIRPLAIRDLLGEGKERKKLNAECPLSGSNEEICRASVEPLW